MANILDVSIQTVAMILYGLMMGTALLFTATVLVLAFIALMVWVFTDVATDDDEADCLPSEDSDHSADPDGHSNVTHLADYRGPDVGFGQGPRAS